MKKKRIIVDFFYSIFAYSLPTLALQLVIQPLLANYYTDKAYGLFLTLFSVVHLGINCLITPLSSLRLLKKKDVNSGNIKEGTFNYLFIVLLALNISFVSILSLFYIGYFSFVDIFLLAVLSLLISFHDYYAVRFRLEINYKKIILDNVILVFGFFVGFLFCFFFFFDLWEFILIFGYLFSAFYLFKATRMWSSKPTGIGLKNISPEYVNLSVSSSLNNSLTYCDKLIIYPALGANAVSVYGAATVVSKLISFIAAPIRNVLLSYVVDENQIIINKKEMLKSLVLFFVGSCVFLLLAYLSGLFFGYLLYNKYYNGVKEILFITVLSIFVETMSNVLNVLLLKLGKTKIQTFISILKVIIYIAFVFGAILFLSNKLLGFCFAALCANIIQLICIVVFLKNRVKFA